MNTLNRALSILSVSALATFYSCTSHSNNSNNSNNSSNAILDSSIIERQIPKANTILSTELTPKTGNFKSEYEDKLHNADKILISEVIFSIGKKYEIYVNDEEVATVQGKNINWWADKFVLETIDKKILESEQEHKRILTFNRSASFYNSEGDLTGYMAENVGRDLLKLNHLFHIYNPQQEEIGKTSKSAFTILDKINVYDAQGNTDYHIKQRMNLVKDKYDITVIDKNSVIPIEKVILLTCIEDAIKDAKKAKSSSSDDD